MAQPKPAPATSSPSGKRSRILAGTTVKPVDSNRAAVIAAYEAAITLMQAGKFDKAHAAFNKMLEAGPSELSDRIRMYTSACLGQITKGSTTFESHEEQCDFAISLLNNGNYPEAGEHFQQILSEHPTADYAFYGLAVLASITGDPDGCLENLTRAIHHNPKNRIQARSDSDFQNMADDPRFTELLYPES